MGSSAMLTALVSSLEKFQRDCQIPILGVGPPGENLLHLC